MPRPRPTLPPIHTTRLPIRADPPIPIADSSQALCASEFFSRSLCHLVAAGLGLVAMVALVWLGMRWKGTTRQRRLVQVWAWSTIGWQAYTVVWWLLPANFQLDKSLSLHVCDLAAWIAPIALLTRNRAMRTMLYFWGIGMSTQAFFTPTLTDGTGHMHFWFFWIGHTQIVGSACYDLIVRRYRPRWSDLGVGIGLSMAYVAVVLIIDLALGVNYGFVGRTLPDRPTLVDKLGPWPWRAIWLVLIGNAVMVAMVAVWSIAGRVKPAAADGGEPMA